MTTLRAHHGCWAFFILNALLGASPAAAGWEPLGGPTQLGIVLRHAPGAPATLYASVLAGSVPLQSFLWRSDDSGLTWRSLQPGLLRPVGELAIDPLNADVVWGWVRRGYSNGDELWRTADGGVTWERRFLSSEGLSRSVTHLIADPRDPATIYRVEVDFAGFRLLASHDGGRTFGEGALVERYPVPEGVILRPEDGELIAFTSGGLYASRDDGATWSRRGSFRGHHFVAGAMAPSRSRTLYGVPSPAGACLARSDDAGEHWRRVDGPRLPRATACRAVAVGPVDARHLWVVAEQELHHEEDNRCYLAESRDGGGSWSSLRNFTNGGVLAAGGSRLFAFGNCLLPKDPAVASSADGGRSWTSIAGGIGGGDARSGLVALPRPNGGRRVIALSSLDSSSFFVGMFASSGDRQWEQLPVVTMESLSLAPAGPFALVTLGGLAPTDTVTVMRSTDGGAAGSRPSACMSAGPTPARR